MKKSPWRPIGELERKGQKVIVGFWNRGELKGEKYCIWVTCTVFALKSFFGLESGQKLEWEPQLWHPMPNPPDYNEFNPQ